MLALHPAPRPVTHAVSLTGMAAPQVAQDSRSAWVAGSEALRMATLPRLRQLEAGAFWQALLHPALNLDAYGGLLLQLSSVWTPVSRALRERAEGLDRPEWLPPAGTARLQADLACLRRLGMMQASPAPRRVDLPRGDASHLLGMTTVVRQLQVQCTKVARHVDARLGLGGEGRRFFLDPAAEPELMRQDWAAWRRKLDAELRTRETCEGAIRGACGLIDVLQSRLNDTLLVA